MSHSGDSIPSAASTPHKRMQALSMSFSMSPSMFATPPRSASAVDRRYQGRYSEGSTAAADKEKGVNVQVILRCRPLSEDERKANCNQVVSCNDKKREVVVSYNTASKLIDKTFTFDKVFGPKSQQKSIYDQAISSFVTEVLDGYNCTIFAYGQTGTGKTYTMEGGGKMNYAKNGDLPVDAGVIPRAVRQIIDTLESQNADYSMKVTFLELYNEEITDLLANDDSSKNLDDKSRKPITLMEDGRGGVLVKGLEEEVVYSANEIFTLLHRGSSRRRTTETLQNKQSSRSHSIFSITIHIKETTPEGEELIKCGKLNLVDLAGSENISRSGARESGRTREAGEINKSLLTLGRVITSLVEHQVHVPYRDSKLTRLLRDSLGGKTKTCIIATVSPAAASMEETLNTLDYAHRAKSIRNRPEVNQRMMKSALIKDLYADIDRLKQEVRAAREKNGVYIPRELHLQDQAEKKATSEKIERLELEAESKNKFIQELQDLLKQEKQTNSDLMSKLETTEERLAETKEQLVNCQEKNKQANCTIKENEFIISNMLQSEKSLIEKASGMRLELENTARDVDGLFAKIARKAKIETGNHALVKEFRFKLSQHVDGLHSSVVESILQQQQHLTSMNEQLQSITSYKTQTTDKLKEKVEEIRGTHISSIKKLNLLAESLEEKSRSTFIDIDSTVSSQSSYLLDALSTAISKAERIIEELQSALKNQEERMVSFVRKQQEGTENTIESTRKISMTIIDFFKNLDEHACSLSKYIEQAQSNQAKRLEELHKSYKECSAQEHDNMMAKIAEIIGRSTATKLSLMETGVQNICDMAACNAHVLQERIGSLQNIASDAQHHWNTHVMQAEDNFVQSNTETENGHRELQGTLNDCATKTMLVRTHWKETKAEMVMLEEGNKKEVEHIIKNAQETNRLLTASISEAALSAETEANNGGQCLLSALTDSLVSERDSSQAIRSVLSECNNNISNMQKTHQDNAAVIGSEAEKYLKDDYLEDEATCSTPKKRSIQIPSLESLEKLQTPSVEELLQGFWEEEYENRTNLVNGEAKHLCSSSDATSTKDSRPPLAAINN